MSQFFQFIRYSAEWILNPARLRGRVGYPTTLSLLATDNCNSKCVMCDIWKEKSENELSPEQFGRILSDRLFHKVRHVGISGGEPTLRNDLVEIVAQVLENLPSVRGLSITTHGFHTKKWQQFLPKIEEICRQKEVHLRINLSVDGIGELHNEVRGTTAAFRTVMETLEYLETTGVEKQLQTTLTSLNAYGAARTLSWAEARGHDIVFRKATEITRLGNRESMHEVTPDPHQESFLSDFFASLRLNRLTRSPQRRLFYQDLAKRLADKGPRKAPCIFQNEGIVLTAHGDLFHCSISTDSMGNAMIENPSTLYFSESSQAIQQNLIKSICPGCVHDQSGIWSPATLAVDHVRQIKLVKTGLWCLRAVPVVLGLVFKQFHAAILPKPPRKDSISLDRVLIIGAYGGEHVGDAAILGGVLLRLKQKYGISRATIASIRPHRTQRWIETLHTDVLLDVCVYDSSTINRLMDNMDAVVLGGGPLMDLPKSLNQHLGTIIEAKKRDKLFLIEGIGVGPFNNRLTQSAARAILKLADAVVVRSDGDLNSPSMAGIVASKDRDPAFDYLATRDNLSPLNFAEAKSLAKLMHGTDGKFLLGINLRPLWAKYAAKGHDMEAATTTFIRELANGIVRLNQELNGNLVVFSFPMNPDQYGFSDLHSAQTLDDALSGRVEHRIWEAEPGIDAVLSFIRQMDAVLAMRFHACIFSLSQQTPTFGIDYSLDGQGKVGKLLTENGHGERLNRMDSLRSSWIPEKIGPILRNKKNKTSPALQANS